MTTNDTEYMRNYQRWRRNPDKYPDPRKRNVKVSLQKDVKIDINSLHPPKTKGHVGEPDVIGTPLKRERVFESPTPPPIVSEISEKVTHSISPYMENGQGVQNDSKLAIGKHFKTDAIRTSFQLLTGASIRGNPEIVIERMIEFLEDHEPILFKNKWYWRKRNDYLSCM